MLRATSPGTALTRKNVSTAVASSVTADQNRRVSSRLSISVRRIEPHAIVTPEPDRMRVGAVYPRIIEDGNLFVDQWRPWRIPHDQVLRLSEQSCLLYGIQVFSGSIQAAIHFRIVVKSGIVTFDFGDAFAIQQHIQKIAGVGIILKPAPDAAGCLVAGGDFLRRRP